MHSALRSRIADLSSCQDDSCTRSAVTRWSDRWVASVRPATTRSWRASSAQSAPTTAAGTAGSGLQSGCSAAGLKELRGPEVAALLSDLNRYQKAQLVAVADPSAAVEALRQLDSGHR